MADSAATSEASQPNQSGNADNSTKTKTERRKIPGNLPYTSSPGVLKRVLEKVPTTEKPTLFNTDFLSTVMQASGGAARPVLPIMKSTGLLSQSSVPTELYTQFQTETGRSAAALQALKNGFSEIFRRNQYAHRAPESNLIDIIVAVTGLPKSDSIVRYILNTFQVFQGFAKDAPEARAGSAESVVREEVNSAEPLTTQAITDRSIGLVYNLNIVLPETTNVEVYNAIFKSLRGNLLRD